jgi:hypothetical protein
MLACAAMADDTRNTPPGWHAPAHARWLQGDRGGAIQAAVTDINTLGAAKPSARVLQLAYYLFLVNDFAGAALLLEQVLQAQPDHLEALANLAVCRSRMGRHAEVVTHAQAVLAQQPEHALALDVLTKSLFMLGRQVEAAQAGARVLQLKDRHSGPPAADWVPPAGHPAARAERQGAKQVIAFSLWGSQPCYLRGALRNVLLAPDLYPGWTLRFHVDDSVPADFLALLRQGGAEVALQPSGQSLRQRLCWRFQVANDPAVGRFLVRDCDSVFSLREVQAVQAWCASDRWFHVIRDWWTHTDLVLAGLWGGVAGVLPDLAPLLAGYDSGKAETPNIDQWFLRDRVWPMMRGRCLVHDRLFRTPGSQPLPPPADARHHIGQDEFAAHRRQQESLLRPWIDLHPCLGERLVEPAA